MNGYPEMIPINELPVMSNYPQRRVADLCSRCLAGHHKPRPCLNVVAAAPADHVCRCLVCDTPEKEYAA